MARSKRVAVVAAAALALVVPASAQADTRNFEVGLEDVSWTDGGLGANLLNITDCPESLEVIRCDAAILTATKAGTLTINLDVPDTADYDLYVFRGTQWASDKRVASSDTGHFIGEDESVTTATATDEQFRVEIVYFLTGPSDIYTASAQVR